MPEHESLSLVVDRDPSGGVRARLTAPPPLGVLQDEEVQIEVHWSSLNYKDALAARGHPGVVRKTPLIPGIDAAGVVSQSRSRRYEPGQLVLATGHDFGVGRDGGWSPRLTAPADWLVPLPDGLTLREAMTYGTAGFTAAQCVEALQRGGVSPDKGEVLVSGATGGVGSLSVSLLAKLGYQVTASTGKADRWAWLERLGAARCVSREEIQEDDEKPLLKGRWAGAIDTVGGRTLATLVRSLQHRGCVAACGLVGGAELPLTVHPFILRGVTLAGIDSAWCPYEPRLRLWSLLAGPWKLKQLSALATEISCRQLPEYVAKIEAGHIAGRVIVNMRG